MNDRDAPFDPAVGHPRKWQILAIMCTCLVLVVASVSSLNIAIPSIVADLEPSGTQTLWIVDSYALVFAGLLLLSGAIGDRFGRKEALLVGLVTFAACAVWASYADTPTALIVARGTMAIGASLIMPATLSILVSVFPVQERGTAIAVWSGFAGAGGAVGIIAGGALLETFWWGSVFFINVPIALIAGVLIFAFVPTSKDDDGRPLDVLGALFSVAGLGSLVYAIIEGGESGWLAGSTIAWFVAAVLFIGGFIRFELGREHPLLDPRLFRRRPFALGSLTITAAFSVMFGMFFLITQYFQFVQEYSPLQAGIRNLPFAVTMILVAPRSPAVAARLGTRGAIVLGLCIQAVGFGMLSTLGVDTTYWFTAAGIALMAAGLGLLMPPASEAIVSSLPPHKAGVGSAVNDTTREVGGSLGIAVLGTLLATGFRDGISPSVTGLSDDMAELAEDSIGGAFRVAAEAGRPELFDAARDAFVDGMTLAFTVAAVFGVVIAGVIFARYPRAGVVDAAPAESHTVDRAG